MFCCNKTSSTYGSKMSWPLIENKQIFTGLPQGVYWDRFFIKYLKLFVFKFGDEVNTLFNMHC